MVFYLQKQLRPSEHSDGLFTLLFEKLSTTRLKLFARTAQTRLFHRRQSNSRINKVPTPVYFHKRRQFMMALSLPVLFKIRLKLDQSMQLAKRYMTDNLQSPTTASAYSMPPNPACPTNSVAQEQSCPRYSRFPAKHTRCNANASTLPPSRPPPHAHETVRNIPHKHAPTDRGKV